MPARWSAEFFKSRPRKRVTRGKPDLLFDHLETRDLLTNLPPGFSETVVASGLIDPTTMAFAPDGRLFVAQQTGQLRIIENGQLLSAPFLSLNVDSTGERGLLGVAFDPNFESNHYVYVYYTVPGSPAHNRVSRFTANGDTATPGSEVDLLDIDPLSTDTRHNGGAIHFGPDGKLYIAVGDNKVSTNSQSLMSLKGKILRINPDGSIPTDNPFYNQTTGVDRAIWALGLRNPYTFAFGTDPTGAARMFINDVGENTWEEINDGIAGSNYGWPIYEGPSSDPNYRAPIFAYNHNGQSAAITGGVFYNPTTVQFPKAYVGEYFFSDYVRDWIDVFNPVTGTANSFATNLAEGSVDLLVDPAGSLYYLAGPGTNSGEVVRIDYSTPPTGNPPTIVQQPQSLTVSPGQSAVFSVVASGSGNLAYQWQRNGLNILGAVLPTYVLPSAQVSDNGAGFDVLVSNAFGQTASGAAILTVRVLQPPTPTITSPAPGATYIAGQAITFSGGATDPQDGTLAPSALTWEVDRHDSTGVHTIVPPITGVSSDSFTVPQVGDLSTAVFYRITLTATDAEGLSQRAHIDVSPHTAVLGLITQPAGLPLTLDGQTEATPGTVADVSGMIHSLQAPMTEVIAGVIYQFAGWSDGVATAARSLVFPSTNTNIVAGYQPIGIVPYVTVNSASESVRQGTVQSISLVFSGALDAASAKNRADSWLVLPGRDRVFGTRDDRYLRFRTTVYQAAANTVRLVPSARLSTRQAFEVIAVGSGSKGVVRDSYGRPIDGNRDVQPGGDFVTIFAPGKTAVNFAARSRATAPSIEALKRQTAPKWLT